MKSQGEKERPSIASAAFYYLVLPLIYLVASLPFGILYLLSDILYLFIYGLIRYRRKVVTANLRNSFPGKPDADLRRIRRRYYLHFCDLFLETLKMLTMSRDSIVARCHFTPEAQALLDRYAAQGRSVILAMGHMGNWEWSSNACNILAPHQLYVIYHPITNPYIDGLMRRIRSRFGTRLITMRQTYREMAANKNHLNATAFVADQSPIPDQAYWTTFLNQDTPVFRGVEVIAKKMNLPVLYTCVKKVRRGCYEMQAETLCDNPAATADGALCELFIRRLEKDIVLEPESWLWTHRRWKHRRPE